MEWDFEYSRVLANVDYCVAPQNSYHPLLTAAEFSEEWKESIFSSLLGRLQTTLDFMDKDGSTLLGIALNTVSLVYMYMSSGANGPSILTGSTGLQTLKNSMDWIKVLWKHDARVCQFQHHKLVFVDADLEFDDGDAVSEKDITMVRTAASRWREHLEQLQLADSSVSKTTDTVASIKVGTAPERYALTDQLFSEQIERDDLRRRIGLA